MESEEKFWAFIWAVAGAVVLGISLLVFAYHSAKPELISKMVADGADPMAASCALDHPMASVCSIWLAGQKAKN